MLSEPEIDATQKIKAPTLGIDSRALFKGLQRNDSVSNVNAFAMADRLADERFYGNMPMNAFSTDPLNMEHEKKQMEKLLALLLERGKDANTMRMHIKPKEAVVDMTPIPEPALTAAPTVEPAVTTTNDSADAEATIETDIVAPPTDGLMAAGAALSGAWTDLASWETLPGNTTYEKFRSLIQRENRLYYLMIFLVCMACVFVFLRFFVEF
jgi:hypothetical protein